MPYNSVFPKSFKKEFRKLPTNVQEIVLKTLNKAADNPYAGKRLEGKLEGLWRFVFFIVLETTFCGISVSETLEWLNATKIWRTNPNSD